MDGDQWRLLVSAIDIHGQLASVTAIEDELKWFCPQCDSHADGSQSPRHSQEQEFLHESAKSHVSQEGRSWTSFG